MAETERLDLDSQPAAAPERGAFHSILFTGADDLPDDVQEPTFFRDLNLDQLVEAVVADREEYDLKPFFHAPLHDVDAVEYRHEVFRDIENDAAAAALRAFTEGARRVRSYLTLAKKQHYAYEKERWFLDAAIGYCDTVAALRDALAELELDSRGLQTWRDWLAAYAGSDRFTSLDAAARRVLAELARVRYAVRIKDLRVTVTAYEDEADYSVEVEETFARFRQGQVDEHLIAVSDAGSMDHVEAQIVERVARLYPKEFKALDEFCAHCGGFVDVTVARFEREAQFYLAYLELVERLRGGGVAFCYPEVSRETKDVSAEGAIDAALAAKLVDEQRRIVPNDLFLSGAERVLVVSGPNQGGKTTFARTFGQLHYLAALGLPVAARNARLFLADQLFTHFERAEDIATLRGKLDDELVRVREILEQAGDGSVVILNEIFASTTLDDALFLGEEVLRRIIELDCLAVCVTFLDELSTLDDATASMVAQVEPDDPSRRTFEVVRKPADGRAYAWALAEKYGLSYERLRSRIGP